MDLDLDFDRERRLGLPEVIFGPGKTEAEILAAATRLFEAHGRVLVTRTPPAALGALAAALPSGQAHPRSGCFLAGAPEATLGPVAVVSAGTADAPVAEEACVTLAAYGIRTVRCPDCGVAGLHRLMAHRERIASCQVAIVVAGMDAALPTVLGGLIDLPMIGCPTSVGYGVASGGHSALNAMLASCAPGLAVVNIDNGFGAASAAARIVRAIARAMSAAPDSNR